MKHRVCTMIALLVFKTFILFGQGGVPIVRDSKVLNPVPPSPEMASLGKFGDLEFEKATGTAAYSIPIYTLNYDGISLPLTLQYNSSGFRPSDIGSYLGLHWMLNGLGGISRSIKGDPDESGYLINSVDQAYINQVVSQLGTLSAQSLIQQFNNGIDISQDAYNINSPGFSGKFFINSQKQFTFSVKTDYKLFYQVIDGPLEDTLKLWTKDTRGNRYEFDVLERTYISSQNGYSHNTVTQDGITSWKLSKIITAGGKEIIFNYTDYVFSYIAPSQDVFISKSRMINPPPPNGTVYCGCSPTDTWQYGNNMYIYHTKVISSIVTNNETIEFSYTNDPSAYIYQKKLTQIIVKDYNSTVKKKFELNYGYYSGTTRFKLTEFRVVDALSSGLEPSKYSFTYHENYTLPGTESRGLDAFQFFNGATSNTHLIVSNQPALTTGSADRIARPEYAQQSLLKEVIYPTKGKTLFIYESNGDVQQNNLGAGLRVKELQNKDENGNITGHKTYAYKNFQGPPLLINNTPYEVFVEYSLDESFGCSRLVLTSNNQASSVGNTIPLSEEFYYREVDVIEKGGNGDIKSTFTFIGMDGMSGDLLIRPDRELLFKTENNVYTLVNEKKYEYEFKGMPFYSDHVLQYAVLPATLMTFISWPQAGEEWCVNYYNGVAQSLPRFQSSIRLIKTIEKKYNGLEEFIVSTEFGYGASHEMPVSILTTDSKGNQLEKKMFYPTERNLVSNPVLQAGQLSTLSTMVSQNMLNYMVAQELRRGSILVDATRTHYGNFQTTYYLPAETFDWETSSTYRRTVSFLEYDNSGNLTRFAKEADHENMFIWDYKNQYPVAKIVNATSGHVAYTSFEADGSGHWSIPSSNRDNTSSITGKQSYLLTSGSITKNGLSTSIEYFVTYWIKNSSTPLTITGTQGTAVELRSSGNWKCFLHKITGVSQVTISGAALIDELRLYPRSAQLTSTTYDCITGITSQCDENNRINYYEYDGLGRLKLIKDQDGNIVKMFEYNYKD